MKVVEKPLTDILPYENNPRRNDSAVDAVAASIREFGFKVPIIVDRNGVIVAGHTRYKAAQKLGLEKVPCVVASDLSPEKVRAFRLADNKVSELAGWDFELLGNELGELKDMGLDFSMEVFGFVDDGERDVDGFFEAKPDAGSEEKEPDEPEQREVTCPHCGETFMV